MARSFRASFHGTAFDDVDDITRVTGDKDIG
jgi:hypothetical protein